MKGRREESPTINARKKYYDESFHSFPFLRLVCWQPATKHHKIFPTKRNIIIFPTKNEQKLPIKPKVIFMIGPRSPFSESFMKLNRKFALLLWAYSYRIDSSQSQQEDVVCAFVCQRVLASRAFNWYVCRKGNETQIFIKARSTGKAFKGILKPFLLET